MWKRWGLVAGFCLFLASCFTPIPGDPCGKENRSHCINGTNAIFCEGGTYRAYFCTGPGGCTEEGDAASCDLARSRAGDACPSLLEGQGQCDAAQPDKALMCRTGTWVSQVCNACSMNGGGSVSCGAERVGDPCTTEGREQCMASSSDRAMVCRSGVWATLPCNSCTPKDADNVTCGVPLAGEPCSASGKSQCDASDGNRKLECRGGRWVAEACNNCGLKNGQVECGPPRQGDTCTSEGKARCDSTRVDQLLVCRASLWSAQECKACTPSGSTVKCAAASVGDPCIPSQENDLQCNAEIPDRIIVCRGERWLTQMECPQETVCNTPNGKPQCR